MLLPIVRRAYPAAALAWAALLPIGTYAATRVHASTSMHLVALATYGIGAFVCHQRPERSFHLWGAQLAVCARCTGIYLGAAIVALVARAFQASGAATGARRSAESLALPVLILALIPTIGTLVFEWTTGIVPSNTIRFAAGLPLGAVVSWVVLSKVE